MNTQTQKSIQDAIDFLDGSYEAHKVRKALQEALAQTTQEPDAYLSLDKKAVITRNMRIRRTEEEMDGKVIKDFPTALYTHPAPTKQWVGLSDDEMKSFIDVWGITKMSIQDLEASLKEKNS